MYPALLLVKYFGFFFGRSPDGVNNIVYGYNEGRTNVAWEDYEKKEMLRFLLFESKVATVFYLRNIKVNSFWQNIQQRQIQNILGPTVNYVWHQPTHFFDHASKIFVLKQGVPNGLI